MFENIYSLSNLEISNYNEYDNEIELSGGIELNNISPFFVVGNKGKSLILKETVIDLEEERVHM